MSLYPELDKISSLQGLVEAFWGPDPDAKCNKYEDKEMSVYWQEVVSRILDKKKEGIDFLINAREKSDVPRLRAIIFGLGSPSIKQFLKKEDIVKLLFPYLNDCRPLIVAETIDSINSLNLKIENGRLIQFLEDSSPYVVGSALRFMSKHYPKKVIPFLYKALKSFDFIVRENAVDQLDDLGIVEAIPNLVPLLNDPHPDVRQAVQSAIHNLGQLLEENKEK